MEANTICVQKESHLIKSSWAVQKDFSESLTEYWW
jgi:hypothetical protein